MMMMMMLRQLTAPVRITIVPYVSAGIDRPGINELLKEQVRVAEAKASSARPHDSAQQKAHRQAKTRYARHIGIQQRTGFGYFMYWLSKVSICMIIVRARGRRSAQLGPRGMQVRNRGAHTTSAQKASKR